MRRTSRVLLASVCAAASLSVSDSFALEKTRSLTPGERPQWNRATAPCTINYYNDCTGWVWRWSGWGAEDRFGAWFDSCCPGGSPSLEATWIAIGTPSPSGYGFTGTIDVWNADSVGTPTGPPLRSTPFLPVSGSSGPDGGWNEIDWSTNPVDVSAGPFVITYTLSATAGDPMSATTDHPPAGPTGPQACGTCYPTDRPVRSFYYGTASAPTPGIPFDDGSGLPCAPELFLDAVLSCPTAVEPTSWGRVKDLYR